jgi:hypothetical protein
MRGKQGTRPIGLKALKSGESVFVPIRVFSEYQGAVFAPEHRVAGHQGIASEQRIWRWQMEGDRTRRMPRDGNDQWPPRNIQRSTVFQRQGSL